MARTQSAPPRPPLLLAGSPHFHTGRVRHGGPVGCGRPAACQEVSTLRLVSPLLIGPLLYPSSFYHYMNSRLPAHSKFCCGSRASSFLRHVAPAGDGRRVREHHSHMALHRDNLYQLAIFMTTPRVHVLANSTASQRPSDSTLESYTGVDGIS
ncbi:hypothetical protein BKA93DRAFT_247751 [Sparassis latifolia]